MRAVLRLAALLLALPAAAAEPEATAVYGDPAPPPLLIRGTTDIAAFAPVIEAFLLDRPELGVTYEQWGSNDLHAVAGRACAGEAPPADMVISSAIDLQVELVNRGCARSYRSTATGGLPAGRIWRDELWGVTREPAVIVYNRELVPPERAPASRFDLIDLLRPADSRFIGRVATYDIEASGLGYLFAFADAQQATTFGSLLEALGRSGAVATCCSAELIDGVAEGRWLIAYNVLGSYALARARLDPRIVVVAPEDYTLVLSRAAMIPDGARNPATAEALLDFMLSDEGRRALARSRLIVSFGDSGDSDVELPEGGTSALRPIPLSPVLLVGLDRHKRALFIERWRDALRPMP